MSPSLTYLALFVGFALEGTSLPVPAELICLVSGHNIALGLNSFWGSVLAATAGNAAGGLLAYGAGFLAGESLRAGSRPGRLLGVNRVALERAEGWFHRHGALTTFAARWVGFIRPAALLGAGAMRMPLGTYAVVGSLGSFTYCLVWQYLGWKFAPWLRQAVQGHLAWGVLALVGSIALGLGALRCLGRKG
ncbi:MAG: VTT domain-containing protein [Bacillota bacterium]|nr:VTT domain-containing protein [Bacillota bacterium]MDI7249136.1 VTT domain-containing protein [Bacillota bacterium]